MSAVSVISPVIFFHTNWKASFVDPQAAFLVANTNTNAQASAVNQTIFFLSTVKSSIAKTKQER